MNFKHVGCDIDYDLETVTLDGKRYYKTPDGKLYPSVTTITSQYGKEKLLEWRKKVGEEEAKKISAKASGRGTRVHQLCENYLNNQIDYAEGTMPDAFVLFKSIKPIIDDHVNNIHALEVPLYSNYLRVAGRVDCIAEFDGKLSVIDFKTASKPKDQKWITNYFMQCSAYAVMYEERTKIPVSRIAVIIAVDGDLPQVFLKKRDEYISEFIRYREMYDEVD